MFDLDAKKNFYIAVVKETATHLCRKSIPLAASRKALMAAAKSKPDLLDSSTSRTLATQSAQRNSHENMFRRDFYISQFLQHVVNHLRMLSNHTNYIQSWKMWKISFTI